MHLVFSSRPQVITAFLLVVTEDTDITNNNENRTVVEISFFFIEFSPSNVNQCIIR